MTILQEYVRPATIEEALSRLARESEAAVPLAGGTWLVGQLEIGALPSVETVVDLRSIGLNTIEESDGHLTVGAMCTMSDFISHPAVRSLANGVLVQAARGEGPINLRNAATLGGLVARAESDSELYTALLALDAQVRFTELSGDSVLTPLANMDKCPGLITAIELTSRSCHGAFARIARTPSDRPIVAAVAVQCDGAHEEPRVALCGVSHKPILSDAPSDPPDDYKGSAGYRSSMAEVVVQRAIAVLEKAKRYDS